MVKKKPAKSCGIVILAAGKGTRLNSKVPKVLCPISGTPLIYNVLNSIYKALPDANVSVVVGYEAEQVKSSIQKHPWFEKMSLEFVFQKNQLGTGDAVKEALSSPWGEERLKEKAPLLVLSGDQPLITEALLSEMVQPLKKGQALRFLSFIPESADGYGRVVRQGRQVKKIVEDKDASIKEKEINEVASLIYFFESGFLKSSIGKIKSENAQSQFYLPDLVSLAIRQKKKAECIIWKETDDVVGINSNWDLMNANKILNQRNLKKWALNGVLFEDPSSTWIEQDVELAKGVLVSSNTHLKGRTVIGCGTSIGTGVTLSNVKVGNNCEIKQGTVAENSVIKTDAKVGPYAHLRPDSEVGVGAKIGNFVELKKAVIGAKTNISHLSYVGDAHVGCGVNIGCGFVTCNYDGRTIGGKRKHPTIIEDNVFMGSDCQVVAPIKIGKGAYVASGSTITEDVEADSLVIARSRQVAKPGYAQKFKLNSKELDLTAEESV
jgi:bifunctional UDP-N-acetylglucosamine pyrophosphorylase / glucosamine-1-phosphate N-acetyltransferase